MPVRRAIVQHMRAIGELLWANQIAPLLRHLRSIREVRWEGYVSTDVEWTDGIEQYISASRMEHDRTWGSEVEMMALAHLLDIPVYTYDTTHGWNRYNPGNVYGVFDLSQVDPRQVAMYVRHDVDHYDIVTSVD